MKVKINNIEWEILEKGPDDTVFKTAGANGLCDKDNNIIYIAKDSKLDYKKKIMKHELAHAFLHVYTLAYQKSYTEEELCEFVALYSEEINSITESYFKK